MTVPGTTSSQPEGCHIIGPWSTSGGEKLAAGRPEGPKTAKEICPGILALRPPLEENLRGPTVL